MQRITPPQRRQNPFKEYPMDWKAMLVTALVVVVAIKLEKRLPF
jgi:hypothetical protein